MKFTKYIKWILMIAGAMRFRTFGAFAGFFLGIFIEEMLEGKSSLFGNADAADRDRPHEMSGYQSKLLILIASILQTNRLISKEQSHYILKYFYRQFGTPKGKFLYAQLKYLVKQPQDYAGAAKSLYGTTRDGKHQIIRFLYGITTVNRAMHEDEKKVLEVIAKNIGMAQYDFERIIASYYYKKQSFYNNPVKKSIPSHYKVLGVNEQASVQEIKKAYRSLVLKFHPDKTSLAKEVAAAKFQEVQEAYDQIRLVKGIK